MESIPQPVLRITALETDIGGSNILRGFDLHVNAGEVVALMGRNGVGKTTTLRSITGGLPIRAGSILLAGQPIHKLPPDARARMGIGYVPQGRDIFPHLTVEENLRIGLVVHKIKGAEAAAALEDRGQILCASAGFFEEGIAAFLAKRPANYHDE